jgi:hypothetical protein
MLQDFLTHVEQKKFPIHHLSITLMDCISKVEDTLKKQDNSFCSPISFDAVKSWGKYD